MSGWFYTDDYQICKHDEEDVYEFIEFNQVDDKFLKSERMTIHMSDWKNPDGEWNDKAIAIIKSYYESLDKMRESVGKESEEQIVSECIYEQTSMLDNTSSMTEDEVEKFLKEMVR